MYTQKGICHLFKIPVGNAKMKPIQANGRETLEQIYARLPDPKPDLLFNGSMFDYQGGWPTGAVKIDGKNIQPKMGVMKHIFGTKDREVFIETHRTGEFTSVTKDMDSALESYPLLLPTLDSSGLNPGLVNNLHPRTAVGISDGFIHLLLTDGRNVSPGLTSQQAAGELKSQGAKKAINLDGGNSTKGLAFGVKFNNQSVNSPIINAIGVWFDEVPILKSVLRNGSKGFDVIVLQKHLGIKIDGSFGPMTEESVRSFQKSKGLTADGVVGPNTWSVLGGKEPPNKHYRREFNSYNIEKFEKWIESLEVTRNITHIQIHHTWKPNIATYQGLKSIQAMFRYHVGTRKFDDIAQHLSIAPDCIWDGRSFDKDPAGIAGHNKGGICIEIIGNFDEGEEKLEGMHLYIATRASTILCKKFNLPINSVTHVFHREYAAKSCPGTGLNKNEFIDLVARSGVSEVKQLPNGVKEVDIYLRKYDKTVKGIMINGVSYLSNRQTAEYYNEPIEWDSKNQRVILG